MGYLSTLHRPETVRYVAPELLSSQGASYLADSCSTASDVYSFAMTSFSVCTSLKPSYYFIRWFCCDQVLTGVLPYHGSDKNGITTRIRAGKRPSRPTGRSRNRWLRDPVWDVITTGWSHEPENRCELSVMHNTFVTSSQLGVYSGYLNNHTDRNLTMAEIPEH